MQKLFLIGILAFGASDAQAADLTNAAQPTYNWSGLYSGINFGGAWSDRALNIPGNSFYGGLSEFATGAQAGYNFQVGNALFGVEGSFDLAGFAHPALPTPTLGSVSNNWTGTAAGRVGFADGRWLVYGKLGAGWIRSDVSLRAPGVSWQGSNTSTGLVVGAGLEYGFKSHWTVRLDYDYFALPAWNSPTIPFVTLDRNVQIVTAGISYKFDSGYSEAANEGAPRASAGAGDLAKQAQNPIADLVSVPFQSNTNFNAGPFNRTQEVFNIQPVVPMHITDDWNVISRTIIPLISQPDPILDSNTNGIGDITQSLFFSPVNSGAIIWGAGPVFTVPSASNPFLGTGHFLVGPTGVIVITPGQWLIGALVNNQWSVGGNPLRAPVNTFLLQPFANYNMPKGWYLTSAPIITANWLAPSGQKWTVPVGGGFGRVFRIGDQPVNAQLSSYYNAVRPAGTPDWQIRATFALLFPVK